MRFRELSDVLLPKAVGIGGGGCEGGGPRSGGPPILDLGFIFNSLIPPEKTGELEDDPIDDVGVSLFLGP